MVHKALKDCHIVALGLYKPDYKPDKVKTWVEAAGGTVTFKEKLADETTHVLLLEHAWREKGPFVQAAIAAKYGQNRELHILSWDWLAKSLESKTKRRESEFCWERKQRLEDEVAKKTAKKLAKMEAKLEPKNGTGLMAQAYMDSTDNFMTEREKAIAKHQQEHQIRIAEEHKRQEGELAQKYKERHGLAEIAAVFRRGVHKSRNELLSDTHHVCMDHSGFIFDVTMTKVDLKHNRNQRRSLTIYESNTEPHTYALNLQYSGTNIATRNDLIATLGSNFETAFRAFKKTYKEYTRTEWKDRVRVAFERIEQEKDARESRIRPPTECCSEPARPFDTFEERPFVYHPPRYGSRGADLVETISQERSISPHSHDDPMAPGHISPRLPPSFSREERHLNDILVEADAELKGRADFLGEEPFETPFDFGHEDFSGPIFHTDQSLNLDQGHNEIEMQETLEQIQPNNLQTPENHMAIFEIDRLVNHVPETHSFDQAQAAALSQETAQLPDTQSLLTQSINDAQILEQAQETQASDFSDAFKMAQTQDISLAAETQSFGHTQAAVNAQADLMGFLDQQELQPGFASPADSARRQTPQVKPNSLDLGGSVLGKRKDSPIHDLVHGAPSKKMALTGGFELSANDQPGANRDSLCSTEETKNSPNEGGSEVLVADRDLDEGTSDI